MSNYIPPECHVLDILLETRFLTGSDPDSIDTDVIDSIGIIDDSINWLF